MSLFLSSLVNYVKTINLAIEISLCLLSKLGKLNKDMVKNTSTPLVLLVLGILLANLAKAQDSVNACGGDATSIGGSLAYSIGQIVYTTTNNSNGNVAQGVQHAFEIYSVDIKETKLNISFNIYPNPTIDVLTLQISDYNNENFLFQLFDTKGKLLINRQILSKQTPINTYNLPSATYFVNIINQENKKVHSFKIIKN